MFTVLFILVVVWAIAATFYAYRWAKIIMLLEDDLSEAIAVHERSVATMDNVLRTPIFFDSPEIRPILDEAMSDIKLCKLATQKLVTTFTSRSKQSYVRVLEQKEEET
jgi:hypothetical protein